jgi:enoyl-CoA hydratase
VPEEQRRTIRTGKVAVTPVQEDSGGAIKITPGVSQVILVPSAVAVVKDALEKSGDDECFESLGQHVARDTQVAHEFPEAANAEEGLAENQKRPTISNDVQRPLDRIRMEPMPVRVDCLRHLLTLTRVVASSYHYRLTSDWFLIATSLEASMSVPTVNARSEIPEGDEEPRFVDLRLAERDGVVRLTLNRPHKRNALSMRLSNELVAAIELVRRSESAKVLIIGGAGDTFCAGDDITEMPQWGNANQATRRVAFYQQMANSLEELDKITIAKVDGYAVGGGLEITMACDFVVASRRAIWGMPEVDVGITPGWGGTTRMTRLIGRRMAKEVNLLGALHPAWRAAELGLWNRVVDHEVLDAEVDRLVDILMSKNQQALRQLKFIINKGVEADLYTAQGFELLSAGLTAAVNGAWEIPDTDRGAGVLAFAEKSELWQSRRSRAQSFWTDGPVG